MISHVNTYQLTFVVVDTQTWNKFKPSQDCFNAQHILLPTSTSNKKSIIHKLNYVNWNLLFLTKTFEISPFLSIPNKTF